MLLPNIDINVLGEPCPMLVTLLELLSLINDIVCVDVFRLVPIVSSWVVL
jgi:hypothetical protein